MKLIIVIIQDNNTKDLVNTLTDKGYRVTKIATTGGFLKSRNSTLLIGVEEEQVSGVLSIIEKICKTKEKIVTSPYPVSESTGTYSPYTAETEVTIGGATIFVIDVDKFTRI